MIWIVDDNFLVDLDRARGIAEGLVRATRISTGVSRRPPTWSPASLEDLKLLQRAGLHQVCQGADSGSPKILKAMNKDFQDFRLDL